METLDGLDAAFLALETDAVHLQMGALLVLEPPEGRRSLFSPSTRFNQVRGLIGSRLHLAPPLRQRVVSAPLALHRPVWVEDPEFDLDAHVRRAHLPTPGDHQQLEDLVAEVMSQPLASDRPLWEVVVVEGLAHQRCALIFKVHHALLDGVSGAELLGAFLDLSPRPRSLLPGPSPAETPRLPSTTELLRQALGGLAGQPATTVTAATQLARSGAELLRHRQRLREQGQVISPGPLSAPRTTFNGTVGTRRRFVTVSVDLSGIRSVARACGTTVNDVVLASVTGALRALLGRRGEAVPEELVAMVPISVRAPQERSALGNRVSGTLVSLPVTLEDPLERLAAVAQASCAAKEQSDVLGDGFVLQMAEAVPPAIASRVVRWLSTWRLYQQLPPPANVIVSNIVGPHQPLWCAGSRVRSLHPVGPVADGVGLNVTVISYGGMLHCGLLACARLVPDLEHVAQAFKASVGELAGSEVSARGMAG